MNILSLCKYIVARRGKLSDSGKNIGNLKEKMDIICHE